MIYLLIDTLKSVVCQIEFLISHEFALAGMSQISSTWLMYFSLIFSNYHELFAQAEGDSSGLIPSQDNVCTYASNL